MSPSLLSQLLSGAEFTTGAEFSRMYGTVPAPVSAQFHTLLPVV